jgi:hypothetical protein
MHSLDRWLCPKRVTHFTTSVGASGYWPVTTATLSARVTGTREKVGHVPTIVIHRIVMASRVASPLVCRFSSLSWYYAAIASAITCGSGCVELEIVLSFGRTSKIIDRRASKQIRFISKISKKLSVLSVLIHEISTLSCSSCLFYCLVNDCESVPKNEQKSKYIISMSSSY